MVANDPSFLPRLVPHLFGRQRSIPTRHNFTTSATSMSDSDLLSPIRSPTGMSTTSDPTYDQPNVNRDLPRVPRSQSPMSTSSDPSFLGPGQSQVPPDLHDSRRSRSGSGSAMSTVTVSVHAPQSSRVDITTTGTLNHSQVPHITLSPSPGTFDTSTRQSPSPASMSTNSSLNPVSLLAILVNAEVHHTVTTILHYYQVRPGTVLSAIAMLASGDENDRRNLALLFRCLFEANQTIASAILDNVALAREL